MADIARADIVRTNITNNDAVGADITNNDIAGRKSRRESRRECRAALSRFEK